MSRSLTLLIVLVLALLVPRVCRADDPCTESAQQMRELLIRGGKFGETVLGPGEVRTVSRFRPEAGEAFLAQWNYGAAGRIECAYLGYRQKGTPYKSFAIDSNFRYARIWDVDSDGVDELLILMKQPWGMKCSASMGTLPHQMRIMHLDTATGTLLDVTRSNGPFLRTFLMDLKSKYDASANPTRPALTTECEERWVKLLKDTYESAWFILLLAASGLAVLTLGMGLSKSSSWRWLAKCIGAVTFLATTAVAIYSLGSVGWHVMAFSDFWSAFQVVTGYRFNPIMIELISAGLSAYAGWSLFTS